MHWPKSDIHQVLWVQATELHSSVLSCIVVYCPAVVLGKYVGCNSQWITLQCTNTHKRRMCPQSLGRAEVGSIHWTPVPGGERGILPPTYTYRYWEGRNYFSHWQILYPLNTVILPSTDYQGLAFFFLCDCQPCDFLSSSDLQVERFYILQTFSLCILCCVHSIIYILIIYSWMLLCKHCDLCYVVPCTL